MSDANRDTKGNLAWAETIKNCLDELKQEKLVFAESCTGGEVVSTLASIPGISAHLCGSFVTYRPLSKQVWLGVDLETITKHTTESEQVAQEMALGALRKTPEATWSLAVVGHFGPNAPADKDGYIYLCIARRTSKGNLKIKESLEHVLIVEERLARKRLATEVCLSKLASILLKRVQKKAAA